MVDSFSEYKPIIEKNLMFIPYIYGGDIDYSINRSYNEIKKSSLTSPRFIINAIVNIYNESIDHLKSISNEVLISEESLVYPGNNWISLNTDKILQYINSELGSTPKYIFTSKSSYQKCGFDKDFILDTKRAFPGYFYPMTKLTGLNIEVFYSPLVEDTTDEIVIYAADNPIQSIVYSIQNMEYSINNLDENCLHNINYNFYYCKFKSVKITIKNISNIRNDKINLILNEN